MKTKYLIRLITLFLVFLLSSCSEEIVMPKESQVLFIIANKDGVESVDLSINHGTLLTKSIGSPSGRYYWMQLGDSDGHTYGELVVHALKDRSSLNFIWDIRVPGIATVQVEVGGENESFEISGCGAFSFSREGHF